MCGIFGITENNPNLVSNIIKNVCIENRWKFNMV